jgi:hypothetical protein
VLFVSLSYGRRSVDHFILVSGSPLGPMTRSYPYPFFSDNCFVVLPVGRPLWREDGSATYSAIADWPGHWGPITTHYRLIWDCVSTSSPLTTRRDYSGGILTRLHTGCCWIPDMTDILFMQCFTCFIWFKQKQWTFPYTAWTDWSLQYGILRFLWRRNRIIEYHIN